MRHKEFNQFLQKMVLNCTSLQSLRAIGKLLLLLSYETPDFSDQAEEDVRIHYIFTSADAFLSLLSLNE